MGWSPPELILRPELEDEPDVEFYGMPVFCRHGWQCGLLEYWDSARDVIEVHLAVSRGGELAINADTRESFASHPAHCNGEIGVEVLDAAGAEIADWSGPQRALFSGNTHCRGRVDAGVVRWPGDRSLAALAGRELRLRFHLRHARLYTFAAAATP